MSFNPAAFEELLLLVAAAIMIIGMRLCWTAPRQRMSIEERAKDGKLSQDEARRKIWVAGWRGPVVTLVGVGLLMFAVMR